MAKIDTKKFILNLFSLFVLTLVVIVILSIYNILKPNSKNQTYNFNSFPNIGPADLPPGKTSGSNCNISIQECPDGSCAKCGDTTFVCKTLTDKDPPYYFTNKEGVRIPMPVNKPICIPDPSKVEPSVTDCNTYTGSWLWTTSPACKTPNNQCWTCASKYRAGDVYDPINGSDTTLLLQNPYDVDDNNNPLFSCSCAPEIRVGGKRQAQVTKSLPGDPYTCHTDICWPDKDTSAATVSGDTIDCDCTGGVKIGPGGPERTTDKKGLCFPNNFCSAGSDTQGNKCTVGGTANIDPQTKTVSDCVCETSAGFAQRKCNSNFVHWDDSTPPCCNTQNPIGYECWNNCNPNNCAPWEPCVNCVCETSAGFAQRKCNSKFVHWDDSTPPCCNTQNRIGYECWNNSNPNNCAPCVNGVCQCPVIQARDMNNNLQTLVSKKNPAKNRCDYSWPPGTRIIDDDYYWLTNIHVDNTTGPCGGTCDPLWKGCQEGCGAGNCCSTGAIYSSTSTGQKCNTQSTDECKGGSCFFPESLVYLKDGTTKQIRDITKNDEVLTSTKDGILFYTKLQYDIWFEIKNEDTYWDYVIVETPSCELKVTNDHRLYMANYKSIWDDTKMAKNLRIGDQIYVYKDNEICVESIVKLTHTKLKGKYDCHTEEGHVIVQNILCSCMDSPVPNWFSFWFWKKLQTRPFLYKLIFKYLYSPSMNWRKNIPNNPIADELFDNSFFLKRKDL
jgi:hypothetical protein